MMPERRAALTVVMAVHNGGRFLRTAVESLLNQSYGAFRLLIVDDASTDDTREQVRAYADARVTLLCLERNVGQTAALNRGIERAATPWIARMDADDYSAPTRLEEQMAALEADPSLQCVGTFGWLFRERPDVMDRVVERPVDHEGIVRGVLQGTPMIHGSLVVSRQALLDAGAYDERYRYSADRELYIRLLKRCRASNIPKPLLGIRQHRRQGSLTRQAADEHIEIITRLLAAQPQGSREARLVRANLASTYRVRVRRLARERRYLAALQDAVRALALSPQAVRCAGWLGDRLPRSRMGAKGP